MTFLVAKNIEHLRIHAIITLRYIKSLNSVVSQTQPAEKEARLIVNRTETKYVESRKNRTCRVSNILLHEQSYEEVSSFKYLVSVVSYNSDVTDDIKPSLNQLSHTAAKFGQLLTELLLSP
jgi:hypothetical protein